MSAGSYFVSDSGRVTGHDDSYSNIFAQQRAAIDEALAFARKRNNILVQLDFGSVDLVLPSKVRFFSSKGLFFDSLLDSAAVLALAVF